MGGLTTPGLACRGLATLIVVTGFCGIARAQTVAPQVLATFPHDQAAFTQGLLLHDGKFIESTGLNERSSLRRVVMATGEVEQQVDLAGELFGEGVALVGDQLIQLTWQNNIALVYDLDFNSRGMFRYEGEGWGLCYDGSRLVMSDGTSRLSFRDPETFQRIGEVSVERAGEPVSNLNELECVGGLVYANVWQTDTIVRIDSASGEVLTTIDATGLLTADQAAEADVLNGIAFDSATGHFFLTGKFWPKVFEVLFDSEPLADAPERDAGVESGEGGRGGVDDSTGGRGDDSPTTPLRDAMTPEATAASATVPAGQRPLRERSDTSGGTGCELLAGSDRHGCEPLWIGLWIWMLSRRRRARPERERSVSRQGGLRKWAAPGLPSFVQRELRGSYRVACWPVD
jgi:glutaminyl-peptide cyclotransferase